MTAIALESEIVGSRFDKLTQTCYFTIERDGKRWTVALPKDAFKQFKGNNAKQLRRNHLAAALNNAMRGKPDGA